MKILLYIIFFIMGAFIGSFLNLAIYRIPLKKDVFHERSFCPHCNHKLNFFDLIPIFSYIFLKGKCRYCKKEIGIKYILVEILSGLIVLLLYISMNFRYFVFEKQKMVYFISLLFAFVIISLISGIDKKNRNINKTVLAVGAVIQWCYIIYLGVTKNVLLMRYSIFLGLLIMLFVFEKYMKKINKSNYFIELISFSLYINMIIDPALFSIICLLTLMFCLWSKVIKTVLKNANLHSIDFKNDKNQVTIGYYMGISTIIIILIQNFSYYYTI